MRTRQYLRTEPCGFLLLNWPKAVCGIYLFINVFRTIFQNTTTHLKGEIDMQFSLAPSDLEFCARTIAVMDDGHPEHVRASLAWLIRNRLNAACETSGSPCVVKTCQQILSEAVGRTALRAAPDIASLPDWCRLYAVTYQVWAGDFPDATGGATSCHRHDRAPSWARHRAPTALIGPYLFYR